MPVTDSGIIGNSVPESGVVHDLRHLIRTAASALDIISRDPLVDAHLLLEPAVASARASLEHAGLLADRAVRGARDGQVTVETFNIATCLTELKAHVEGTWERTIRVDLQADPNLPDVTCSRANLKTAIMNLLLNAREAMPTGGVISMTAINKGVSLAGEIEIRIADTGLGMTQDMMLQAFDPCFTTKTTGLGGLGLPMVKQFLDEIGGRLDIESRVGTGTIVTLQLPAVNEPADERPIRPADPEFPAAATDSGRTGPRPSHNMTNSSVR